ncbi:MAG: hypothetical protein WC790_01925 [Candidatus Paceibacterota bacterium]|jgi:hypothetical protein
MTKKKAVTKKKVVKKKKSGMSAGTAAAIGVGVAAVGAGAYYFLGPKGKQHREKAEVWMTKMETDIEKKLKKTKSVTLPLYREAIDTVAATYSKQYKEHAPEIKALAKKLKAGWKDTRNKTRSS